MHAFKIDFIIRGCLVSTEAPKIPITSNVGTYAWSIKYRLIMKLIAQLATNLRGEFLSLISP